MSEFIKSSGLASAIEAIGYGNPDTLRAMVSYYILCPAANCHAGDWWDGSYAKILYPMANLTSQRISEFLDAIGEEAAIRRFFAEYLPNLGCKKGASNILIDSTGLPNNIRFPLTAVSNHNGEISNEVRLIYVTEQETGLPIFFRYCPGNVIDVTTLTRTIFELKEMGVNTKLAILDAGYYSENNILELYSSKINFVTRMAENRKLYKSLMAEHFSDLVNRENIVGYNGRYAYIKRVECELLPGCKAYAYVGLDLRRWGFEAEKVYKKGAVEDLADCEIHDLLLTRGQFVMVSSLRLSTKEILPVYYTRQQIEQVFDIGKNYGRMTPLRVQGENTFRGHLLLTFIATSLLRKLQDKLKSSQYNSVSLLLILGNQKCKVFENKVMTMEPVKKANDCYKLLGINCPLEIPVRP